MSVNDFFNKSTINSIIKWIITFKVNRIGNDTININYSDSNNFKLKFIYGNSRIRTKIYMKKIT